MKVLHLISGGDKGGAKTAVFSLLLALDERIDITVACFMEGVFWQEVLELPIKSVMFKQRFRNDLSIIRRMAKYIRREGFDIVHAHGARANFICMMLKPYAKVPYVTTVHSDYKLDFTDGLYKRVVFTALNWLALHKMDYYIGVSDAFRGMLVERGFNPARVFSVHNTVENARATQFCPKEEFLARYDITAYGKTLVGIIGRLDYVKGHDIFLRAAAAICAERGDVLFLLAGEGFEEANLRKLANTLGIAERVHFLGFVEDIFSFINAIDVNVCTSRSESFAYMLHEGALMKKPAVATNVGGIPELIIDGETGALVPSEDWQAIAAAIIRYIDDPVMAAAHGEALHTHATMNFSKEQMQTRSIEIYQKILANEKRHHRIFDIMLSGYYGYANSGDDALLDAVIQSLRRERADLSILVLSRAPADTMRDYGVFAVNRLNFFRVRRYMKRTRLVVYGGGSHMQDITSTRSLIYYTLLIHLAKRMGLRVMLYGNGIGPLSKPRNIAKARRALEVCDYISLRDPESYEFIKKIGVHNRNMAVSVDPVFSLEIPGRDINNNLPEIPDRDVNNHLPEAPCRELPIDARMPSLPDTGYFVVSLRPWQYNDARFTEKMAEAINHITHTHGLVPLLVPMQHIDLPILRETARKITGEYVLLPRVFHHNELMTLMARTEFALCMRLHALIYAVCVGVPIIGLTYDPKVANFVAYMNEQAVISTTAPDMEALKNMVASIMKDPAAARAHIAAERSRLRDLAANDARVAVSLLEREYVNES